MHLELKGQTRIALWKQLQDAYEATASVLISCRTTIGLVKVPFRGKQAEQACRNLWVEDSGLANASCDRPLLFVDIRRTRWIETKNWTSKSGGDRTHLVISVFVTLWRLHYRSCSGGKNCGNWGAMTTKNKWRIMNHSNSIINELILTWHNKNWSTSKRA